MAQDLKDTLQLPKTDFPMRAALGEREPVRLAHWKKIGLYGAIQRLRANCTPFVLHDGPPFTNGDVHIGTALNKTLKDIINRYKSMRGFRTPYVPGWDCHGLPIEQKVARELQEKHLQATTAELRNLCADFTETWIARQKNQFKRLGVLADWENEYKTKDPAFEADILRIFASFVAKGLVYRSKKPVYWSIPFATALAEAEIEYKEHASPSIWVKFPVPASEVAKFDLPQGKPVAIVIWTTTPWTIPANLAIALNPNVDYVLFDWHGERLLVAKDLRLAVLDAIEKAPIPAPAGTLDNLGSGAAEGEPVALTSGAPALEGAALEGLQARHPFLDRASPVVLADYVTTESGTGCVHTAPGHGMDDYQTGLKYGLEIYCPVGDDGRYLDDGRIPSDLVGLTTLETVEDLGKKRTSSANVAVLKKLAAAGALLAKKTYVHSYPHCWRSKTPIIFRAVDQWFVALDGVAAAGSPGEAPGGGESERRRALEAIAEVEWIPAWGEARIRSAVESRPDWCISRQRAWGVPIPAFYDGERRAYLDAGVVLAIADKVGGLGTNFWYDSTAEQVLSGISLPPGWPDPARLVLGRDTLDVWFDSGSTHAAVLRRDRGGTRWPADLYLEGSDQHRGWFQSSLWTSVVAFGRAPYRAVLTHGFIVDQERKKISKSSVYEKPQTSDAFVAEYGADVIRLWIASQDFRDDIPISKEILSHVSETYRLFRNTCRFQLANLFVFDPAREPVPIEQLHPLDRWILHQAAELVHGCTGAYESHEFHRVYHLCNQFCSVSLSAIYHDIVKDRLYTLGTRNPLRRSTQTAMHLILATLARLLAPIVTFTADEIWSFATVRKEYSEDSVHLHDWPEVPVSWFDPDRAGELATLLKLRSRINEAIEPKRAAGILGKGLDAAVTLTVVSDDPILGQIKKHRGFLVELFIVSHVRVEEAAPGVPAASDLGNPIGAQFVAINVQLCQDLGYMRCPRCWRWVPALETTPHGEICPRCTEALDSAVL